MQAEGGGFGRERGRPGDPGGKGEGTVGGEEAGKGPGRLGVPVLPPEARLCPGRHLSTRTFSREVAELERPPLLQIRRASEGAGRLPHPEVSRAHQAKWRIFGGRVVLLQLGCIFLPVVFGISFCLFCRAGTRASGKPRGNSSHPSSPIMLSRASALLALAGSATAFSPMMSMDMGRREIVQVST